jgi:hypothetical protein
MMLAVAVVALTLFNGMTLRSQSDFLEKAEEFQARYAIHRAAWQEFADAASENRAELDRFRRRDFSERSAVTALLVPTEIPVK